MLETGALRGSIICEPLLQEEDGALLEGFATTEVVRPFIATFEYVNISRSKGAAMSMEFAEKAFHGGSCGAKVAYPRG
jgi:hypothetical protein